MTYRVIWNQHNQWWPTYTDVEGHDAAHEHALDMSREHGGEVSVHLLPEPTQEPT